MLRSISPKIQKMPAEIVIVHIFASGRDFRNKRTMELKHI